MAKGKGWFFESRRHKLSALGIKTGRKLTKKPVSVLLGNNQQMFYPKGDSPLAETAHRPVTKDIESAVKAQKQSKSIVEAPVKEIRSGFKKLYGREPTDPELNDLLLGGRESWQPLLLYDKHLKYPKHKSIFTSIANVPKDVLKSAKKHPTTALFGGVFLSTMAVTGRYQPAMIGATGVVAIKETIGMPKKLITFHKRRRIEASFFKKHGRKPKKSELKKLMELNYPKNSKKEAEFKVIVESAIKDFTKRTGRKPTQAELRTLLALDYPKKDRGKKILKGALIGATVGALAYKKGKKNNPVPKGTRFAFDSVIKTGKYKGLRPRYTFKNNEVIEIAYFKGKKKVATKKLGYPENDVTIEPPTVSGAGVEKPVATLEGAVVEPEPEKKETALQKTFRIGKATLQRGKEIGAKLKELKEESDKAFMEREHKRLVKAQSELNLIRTRKQVRTTREAIQKERTSIFSPAKKSEEKKGKSILPKIF